MCARCTSSTRMGTSSAADHACKGGQSGRLSELTQVVAGTRGKLKGLETLGSSILRQGELARQLETEQEKVLPFYKSSLEAEEGEEGGMEADVEGGGARMAAASGVVQGGERAWTSGTTSTTSGSATTRRRWTTSPSRRRRSGSRRRTATCSPS